MQVAGFSLRDLTCPPPIKRHSGQSPTTTYWTTPPERPTPRPGEHLSLHCVAPWQILPKKVGVCMHKCLGVAGATKEVWGIHVLTQILRRLGMSAYMRFVFRTVSLPCRQDGCTNADFAYIFRNTHRCVQLSCYEPKHRTA